MLANRFALVASFVLGLIFAGLASAQDSSTIQINTGTQLQIQPSNLPIVQPQPKLTVGNSRAVGPQGKSGPVCGGVVNGTPQASCPPSPAMFEGDAVTRCPQGSFLDIGLKSCWSCPSGFNRTVNAVTTPRACSKKDPGVDRAMHEAKFIAAVCPAGSFRDPIRGGECWSCPTGYERTVAAVGAENACRQGGTTGKATVIKRAQCGDGEILDPRNGGECWTCPDDSIRTVFPIQGEKACQTRGGVRFASATEQASLRCGGDQVFDLATTKNSNVMARIRAQYAGQALPPNLGSGDGGTCWSCPGGTKRSTTAVWSNDACRSMAFRWQPAVYAQPGLFGLAGGEAVVMELIRQRTLINDMATALAPALKMPAAQVIQDTWDDIATEPQNSVVLKLAALARVEAAVMEPAKASVAERQLAQSFSAAVVSYQTFIAQEALDAYDAWVVADAYAKGRRNNAGGGTNMVALFDYGTVPPDFYEIAAESIATAMAAGGASSVAIGSALFNDQMMKMLRPFNKATRKAAAEGAQKAATRVVQKTGQEAAKTAGKVAGKVGSSALKMIGSAGPQIIITAASELLTASIEQVIEIANARPRLLTRLAEAKQPLDLARLITATKGSGIDGHWSIAMSGELAPANLAAIAAAARTAAAESSKATVAAPAAPAPRAAVAPTFDIRQAGSPLCAEAVKNTVGLLPCAAGKPAQWIYEETRIKHIASKQCLVAAGTNIGLMPCQPKPAPAEMWALQGEQIVGSGGLCWQAAGPTLTLARCAPGLPVQKWQAVSR